MAVTQMSGQDLQSAERDQVRQFQTIPICRVGEAGPERTIYESGRYALMSALEWR